MGAWRLDAATGDAQLQARAQPEWQQEYRQLSAGLFQGRVQHVQLPGMRLVREDSNRALHQRGDLGRGAYGFAMPLALSGPGIFNGQRFGLDSVLLGRGDELDLRTPTELSLMAVVVEADLLQPLWQRSACTRSPWPAGWSTSWWCRPALQRRRPCGGCIPS